MVSPRRPPEDPSIRTADPELARQLAYDSMCGLVPNPGSNSSLIVTISPATLQGLASGTTVTTTVEVPVEEITWLPPVFLSGAKIQATASGRRE